MLEHMRNTKPYLICILILLTSLGCASVHPTNNDKRTVYREEELLQACNLALEGCRKANTDKIKLIDSQKVIITEQTKEIERLKDSAPSKSLWFILGSILTAGIVFLVK